MNLHASGSQAQINESLLRKRGFGFDIAATEAQVRQLANRDRIRFLKRDVRCIRQQPGFQVFDLAFGEIKRTPDCPFGLAQATSA
jgi:hypothetical protein